MKTTVKRAFWIAGTLFGILAVSYLALWAAMFFNVFHAHEHCIKATMVLLRLYAEDHGGKYPYDTNGFGDAVLQLLKTDPAEDPRYFTAPGDDGHLLRECLRTGKHMSDAWCTRAYVQGLSDTSNVGIALVFDRYPTRGGDHFRRPWGPWVREVGFLDSHMEIIPEQDWPVFRSNEIALLVSEGFDRAQAEKFYALMIR